MWLLAAIGELTDGFLHTPLLGHLHPHAWLLLNSFQRTLTFAKLFSGSRWTYFMPEIRSIFPFNFNSLFIVMCGCYIFGGIEKEKVLNLQTSPASYYKPLPQTLWSWILLFFLFLHTWKKRNRINMLCSRTVSLNYVRLLSYLSLSKIKVGIFLWMRWIKSSGHEFAALRSHRNRIQN